MPLTSVEIERFDKALQGFASQLTLGEIISIRVAAGIAQSDPVECLSTQALEPSQEQYSQAQR